MSRATGAQRMARDLAAVLIRIADELAEIRTTIATPTAPPPATSDQHPTHHPGPSSVALISVDQLTAVVIHPDQSRIVHRGARNVWPHIATAARAAGIDIDQLEARLLKQHRGVRNAAWLPPTVLARAIRDLFAELTATPGATQ